MFFLFCHLRICLLTVLLSCDFGLLTVDHRLEENAEERERVTASGGEVGRLNVFGGNEVQCNLSIPF